MAYSTTGLARALAGVVDGDIYLTVHEEIPDVTGSDRADGVSAQAATWGTPTDEVTSQEVTFVIGGAMTLKGFGVWAGDPDDDGVFICGDALDADETFSANGGEYNFTATLDAASAPSA